MNLDPMNDLAALPYTGGTTGLPKAAMLTHYNIIACQAQALSFWSDKFEEGNETIIAFLPMFTSTGRW